MKSAAKATEIMLKRPISTMPRPGRDREAREQRDEHGQDELGRAQRREKDQAHDDERAAEIDAHVLRNRRELVVLQRHLSGETQLDAVLGVEPEIGGGLAHEGDGRGAGLQAPNS